MKLFNFLLTAIQLVVASSSQYVRDHRLLRRSYNVDNKSDTVDMENNIIINNNNKSLTIQEEEEEDKK